MVFVLSGRFFVANTTGARPGEQIKMRPGIGSLKRSGGSVMLLLSAAGHTRGDFHIATRRPYCPCSHQRVSRGNRPDFIGVFLRKASATSRADTIFWVIIPFSIMDSMTELW